MPSRKVGDFTPHLQGDQTDLPFRQPASNLTVQQHRNELYQLLDPTVLPLSGSLYSAVWPLAAAFILCVTCVDKEERHTLREGLIQDLHESGGYSVRFPRLTPLLFIPGSG